MVSAERPSSAHAAFPSSNKNVSVYSNTFKTRGQSQIGYTGVVAANEINFSGNTYYMDDLARWGWAYEDYPISREQWHVEGHDLDGTFLQW